MRYAMLAVMLIFAFTMSLVINYGERMIRHHEEEKTLEPETDEMLVTGKVAEKSE